MVQFAEYIWLDGTEPTQLLRSKSRIVDIDPTRVSLSDFPEWGFDGSSTNQATGDDSDCILRPVSFVADPVRIGDNYLVLCEVFAADGTPHATNARAKLRAVLDKAADDLDPYFGFEQEYVLFEGRNPIGWPSTGFPPPQGRYYCGTGSNRVCGREVVEAHAQACIDAGLLIYGVNAEVMLGQWEYQIGYRGFEDDEKADALTVSDHMWYAAWLLHRVSEDYNVTANFENKPVPGDWNGSGCHTNFSTHRMRDPKAGPETIRHALERLEAKHAEHVACYGHKLYERLTGLHETCSIDEFKHGISDRGASIRVPMATAQKGHGYLEDRRPGANSDPYIVCARILATICNIDDAILA